MNILIPDSWLREFLKTKATPEQLKEYLSLCGPSIERIEKVGKDIVYDVEVTSNRPDSMSVAGVAREAAAILPRFGIKAEFINDPYGQGATLSMKTKRKEQKKISIKTDPKLNPRFTAVVLENITVGPSPAWLQKQLELTGIRPLNNIVDITNWLMRAYGQPAHAFDYDVIGKKAGITTMLLRASKKGEKITTLDGKKHTLPGDDIVIEDGSGRLVDLCGIMGAQNSSITETTTSIILFMQTYDPVHIRKTSMALAHRTEAASIFEKGIDSELVLPAVIKGTEMVLELAEGNIASTIYDIYAKPFKTYSVSVTRAKIKAYVGVDLSAKELQSLLIPLGFKPKVTGDMLTVHIPSFRRDVRLDVDVIEEIARMWGYHNITPTLPDTAPPVTIPDPTLQWEKELKMRLRDWGFTELYTYSMISEDQMDAFGLDKTKAYKIANPLSKEWVYMRPKLWPSVLSALKQNAHIAPDLKLFELSMVYEYQKGDLPRERPALMIAWTGHRFAEAKGITEAIFSLFGIPVPEGALQTALATHGWNDQIRLLLGDYGSVSEVNKSVLDALGIHQPVTMVSLYVDELVKHANPRRVYQPIPMHPPVVEDFTFILPEKKPVGPLLSRLADAHPRIARVALKDIYEDTRTVRVWFQDPAQNLTSQDIAPARQAIIKAAATQGAQLKAV